ncbi:ankyrin repeat and fibronectin type-III domain-containing protein 1 [Brachionichthys hirsutus]|uniref:ankyrin repeat and fibronectin type-III domain-containing protein 1 n=1 Tax=Brachionichthys hirsutus TaxID=412623 RepID=UPI0036044D78
MQNVLEMLSYSKFSDLEQWLCMPSSLLLSRTLDSTHTSYSSASSRHSSSSSSFTPNCKSCFSSCSEPGATDPELKSSEWESNLSTPSPGKELSFLSPSLVPVLTSSPAAAANPHSGLSPGGLRWNSACSVQCDLWSPDLRGGVGSSLMAERSRAGRLRDRVVLRKTASIDEWFLHLRLPGRLERGRKKERRAQSLGTTGKHDSRKRRLPAVLTQQMQNLQLAQSRKGPSGPASPSAAKRLYRNLSEKLRGSTSSFEDAYFFGKTDIMSKQTWSLMAGGECLLEAVEQQDLDTVQVLLLQFSADELDLNTPNGQGLMALDVAIMTNNTPIAKLLLRAGAKESPHFLSIESRDTRLNALVLEAEQRAADLTAQAQRDGLSLDDCHKDKQLRAWEWRSKLYRRMRTGFQHALPPEAPSSVRLSVSSSSTLTVTFQEPQGLNATVVTKYRVEWSCLKDFSLLAGEMMLDNLQTLKCIINGLTTGRLYYVRVSAYNMKGWGLSAPSQPPSASPSCWTDGDCRDSRRRGNIEAMERLLQQVRVTHAHYCCGDVTKLQNPSRKQSVSRSLKHLFNSSNKFVKTLKRGVYLAAVFYHKDSLLVTAEEQIPIVEVDDSYSGSFMTDFSWFTKLSCMWEDVRWLRQSTSVSMSSSSTLQVRHKMLTATSQLQSLLGTHSLGRVHYEPIRDRHGNVLLVTIRDTDTQHALASGKWLQVTKLQSQRKSLSTPEEPYALDILIITMQDILAYHRRSTHRLAPGLYLGYLKLSSSVDQIKVLVSQQTPNMLCHTRIRDNANVSRYEWDWIQTLSAAGQREHMEAGLRPESSTPLLFSELQMAIKSLLKLITVPAHQARHYRLYSQEVIELGYGISFLLLLPTPDIVCSAPGQCNPYSPLSGFLHLPLQMFELGHFCAYKDKFISLYCRLSSVLDLDALITQQALREAITDSEVTTAKQRHQLILDYIQQLDEMRRDLRWITDALQYARYKEPHGGIPITYLVDTSVQKSHSSQKTDSTSSMDYLPTPSPELHRWKAISDSLLGPDEDGSSEVFLPADSDYDSSDALSPRELDLLYSPPQELSQQAMYCLSGSAPDVLQIQEHRSGVCRSKDHPLSPLGKDPESKDAALFSPLLSQHSSQSKAFTPTPTFSRTLPSSLSVPLSPRLSKDLPLFLPISPALSDTTKTLESLSLSNPHHIGAAAIKVSAPAKRKLLSRSHRGQYFSGPRWLRGHSGSLSEGVYTKQLDPDLPLRQELPPIHVSHASCTLENRPMRDLEPRTHIRRIFVEPCKKMSPDNKRMSCEDAKVIESGGEEPEGASKQEIDSDDQTNSQVSEILSSTL